MACDQITNFPSYVARRLLSHLIITYDQNTALSSDEARICVKHLHGVDEIRADEAIEYNRTTVQSDEAIEYNRTIVQSSKCGTGSILLNNVTKSRRAQSSVQTSRNDTHNNYDSKLIKRYERDVRVVAGKNGDSSCSVAMISTNAEESQAVKKAKSYRKRDREPSRISVRRVTKLLRRKKYRSRLKKLLKHNFPSSSLIRNFCSNYKKWFILCNSEHFYSKYVFFINKQKEKKRYKYCTGKQKELSIDMLQTKSDFSHNSAFGHILQSSNLKGGMLPANDRCNLPWVSLNERLSLISLMPYDVGGSGDCFF